MNRTMDQLWCRASRGSSAIAELLVMQLIKIKSMFIRLATINFQKYFSYDIRGQRPWTA